MHDKKTYLVTGGAGFIGTNLAHALIKTNNEVRVIDNLSAGNKERLPENVLFYENDIRDIDALEKACVEVDVVIHLAALPRVQYSIENPVITQEVNVNGTLAVLEACRKAGVKRVVYAASSSAYGDQEVLPLSVELPADPKSPYAMQKYMGEQLMRLYATLYELPTISLRFFNVYGPYLDPDGPYALVIGKFLKQYKGGEPLTITGDGEQTRDFTHVDDVVRAILKAADSDQVGQGEVLNVGYGAQTSINELAKLIGGEKTYVPARIEPKHTLADISKTTELLDWTPTVELTEGVRQLKTKEGLI